MLLSTLVATTLLTGFSGALNCTADNGLTPMRTKRATAGADIVVRNAKVFTAAEGPSSKAAGFAVKNRKFVVVAVSDAEPEAFIGPNTTVKDLCGGSIVPGLFDTHIHHVDGGKMLLKQVQFSSSIWLDQVLMVIDSWASNLKEGACITGGSWGSTLLSEISTADARKRLDDVSHGHPALLSDDSHHKSWANTAALTTAGLPSMTIPELLHSYGITALQEAAVAQPSLDALVALDKEGKLKGWVSCCLAMTGPLAEANVSETEFDKHAREVARDRVRTDFTKLFLDGVPPTETAGFLTPYLPSDEHGCNYHGLVYNTTDELVETLRRYREQGRGTKIHCTGDWSVQVAMDAFEAMRTEGSTQKYQIAHGQFVTPEDRKRMRDLGIVAEISPFIWYPGVIPTAIAAVLPENVAAHPQPNRDLLDLGVLVAGGSDWAAVTVEEGLRIFTINGAEAAGLDDAVGSIEVGKAANFVLVDRDPFEVNSTEIGNTKVIETYVAGELVYSV